MSTAWRRYWRSTTQDLPLRLTPPLRLVVLLHHQWDHVQLLLVGVVGLQSTLTHKELTHEYSINKNQGQFSLPAFQVRTFADSLYARLTPYSITSAPSIASLIASIVDPFMCVKSNQVT